MDFPLKYHLYDQYATVQQQVANNLLQFLLNNYYSEPKRILEIGCGTGIFTKMLTGTYATAKVTANDLFDTEKYVKALPQVNFWQGDIQRLTLQNYDLVVSSSVFQWLEDLDALFSKIAYHSNNLGFSIYIAGNLQEIKEHFGNSLAYRGAGEVETILLKYFTKVNYQVETITLNFSSPREALRHIKNTGVTGEEFTTPSIQKLRSFKATTLTYQVGYFYCEK